MKPTLEIPSDPLQRFLSLTEAVAARKRWFQGWSTLRYAAMGLQTLPGDPSDMVDRMHEIAAEMTEKLGWFSSVRGDLRFCLAATTLRHGRSGGEFVQLLEQTRGFFREAKLRRNELHEALAMVVLMETAENGLPFREQVFRLRDVHEGMKNQTRLYTNTDDYPAAALLAEHGDDLETIDRRLSDLHSSLRALKFRQGNQLQLATHLLYFAHGDDPLLASRFKELYQAFSSAGLHMHNGDYDEIATLCILEQPADAIVSRVLADRETMFERMKPRPSKQEGFSLASATSFLALVQRDKDFHVLHDALNLTQIVAMVQAQQAAAAAAASAAAASAASG